MKKVFKFKSNRGTAVQMTSLYRIAAMAMVVFVMVASSCKKDKETPTLSVDKTSIEAVAANGTYTIAVSANGAWIAAVTPATATWVTVSPASGNGSGTVTVSVAANTDAAAKTASIIIVQGEVSRTVTVTQEIARDVYVAGATYLNYINIATIWKNGVATALTDGTKEASAHSIFVK